MYSLFERCQLRKCYWLCAVMLAMSYLAADEETTHVLEFPANVTPWFTGPLISPSAYTVPQGHVSLEPYFYFFDHTGVYNNHWKAHSQPHFHSNQFQLKIKIGVLPYLDLHVYPQVFYNTTQGRHYFNAGDLPIGINFQLLRSQLKDPWPAMKLALRTNVPLGKFQHLRADRRRTDAIGSGSWQPAAGLVFSKLWHTSGIHFLEAFLSFNYQIGTRADVRGINTYGGAPNTRGTVYPGNVFTVDGAFQYNFTQRWAFTCDFIYQHNNKNRFSGKSGTLADGNRAAMRRPSREQLSLAPGIEYSWSASLGVIGGVWFTYAGRNSSRYTTPIIALSIYI